jgi:hypothetical protein
LGLAWVELQGRDLKPEGASEVWISVPWAAERLGFGAMKSKPAKVPMSAVRPSPHRPQFQTKLLAEKKAEKIALYRKRLRARE